MNYLSKNVEKLDSAFELVRKKEYVEAKAILSLPDELSGTELDSMTKSLSKGFELVIDGMLIEALKHLNDGWDILRCSTDTELVLFVRRDIEYYEGLLLLSKGEANRAIDIFERSADEIEDLAIQYPDLVPLAIYRRAIVYIAEGRAAMSSYDIDLAESKLGQALNQIEKFEESIDVNDPDYHMNMAEIYDFRVGFQTIFASYNLSLLNLDNAEARLNLVQPYISPMEELLTKIKSGSIKYLYEVDLLFYRTVCDLHTIYKHMIVERSPLNEDLIDKFTVVRDNLEKARELAIKAGTRGKMLVRSIESLQILRNNLFASAKPHRGEFGRFSGLISLISIIALLIIIHLTIQPAGVNATVIFLGAMIVSLVVGFGYGAIRFSSLLSIYSKVVPSEK